MMAKQKFLISHGASHDIQINYALISSLKITINALEVWTSCFNLRYEIPDKNCDLFLGEKTVKKKVSLAAFDNEIKICDPSRYIAAIKQ